jgi:dynein intermediate chain 2, axonemal
VRRNPNFIELDNITDLSVHQVNTMRVSTGEKGMFHKEGGWPEAIDPTEPQQYARFMKKIDKDQGFAAQVKGLCEVAERCMLKNNQIDMFEEYFVNEESDHIVENISTKTLMLFKYFFHDLGTLLMSAREVSAKYHGMLMDPTSWQFHMPFLVSSRLLTR